MATTQFEELQINNAAKHHDDLFTALEGRLKTLEGQVASTASKSTSAATKALEATYLNWIEDVRKRVLHRVPELTSWMKTTAEDQVSVDEQNSSEVSKFLNA